MSTIGTFIPCADGYTGHIRTLTVRRQIRIIAADHKANAGAPDYKLLCGDTEVGAAWKALSKTNQDYLAVQIDDPSWPQPIRATLFENDGVGRLVWTRKPN